MYCKTRCVESVYQNIVRLTVNKLASVFSNPCSGYILSWMDLEVIRLWKSTAEKFRGIWNAAKCFAIFLSAKRENKDIERVCRKFCSLCSSEIYFYECSDSIYDTYTGIRMLVEKTGFSWWGMIHVLVIVRVRAQLGTVTYIFANNRNSLCEIDGRLMSFIAGKWWLSLLWKEHWINSVKNYSVRVISHIKILEAVDQGRLIFSWTVSNFIADYFDCYCKVETGHWLVLQLYRAPAQRQTWSNLNVCTVLGV